MDKLWAAGMHRDRSALRGAGGYALVFMGRDCRLGAILSGHRAADQAVFFGFAFYLCADAREFDVKEITAHAFSAESKNSDIL